MQDAREPLERFLTRWRDAAGDLWNPHVELSYLSGFYLLDTPEPGTIGAGTGPHIRYFAYHSLPSHVATRFADLFLTRPRWRPEDMTPFLRGLYPAYDSKAKDKLVAKYVRVVKDTDGAWWYPRRT
jgi:sister chromatid cohesion protein DCC1